MFAGATVMFTRATVVSLAATVVFVAADANPQTHLGARRLCTRENALFVRKIEVHKYPRLRPATSLVLCETTAIFGVTAIIPGGTTTMPVAIRNCSWNSRNYRRLPECPLEPCRNCLEVPGFFCRFVPGNSPGLGVGYRGCGVRWALLVSFHTYRASQCALPHYLSSTPKPPK